MAGNFRYRCALITGASSGLGAEFARQLAVTSEALVLVARREAALEEVAQALRAAHPQVSVMIVAADVTDAAAREGLMRKLGEAGMVPDLLVNNAGMGDYGEFADAEWPKVEKMLRLNIEALTAMAHAVIPGMIERGGGGVINVSSLACQMPIPDFAVYAASKAYVTSFSEAIRLELRGHGVGVTALCPGPVHTGFGEVAARDGAREESSFREGFYVEAKQVVAQGLAALERGRARVFPGWKIALAALALGAIPMGLTRLMMGVRPRRS